MSPRSIFAIPKGYPSRTPMTIRFESASIFASLAKTFVISRIPTPHLSSVYSSPTLLSSFSHVNFFVKTLELRDIKSSICLPISISDSIFIIAGSCSGNLPSTSVPFMLNTMSPGKIPAFAAGDPLSTFRTNIPLFMSTSKNFSMSWSGAGEMPI